MSPYHLFPKPPPPPPRRPLPLPGCLGRSLPPLSRKSSKAGTSAKTLLSPSASSSLPLSLLISSHLSPFNENPSQPPPAGESSRCQKSLENSWGCAELGNVKLEFIMAWIVFCSWDSLWQLLKMACLQRPQPPPPLEGFLPLHQDVSYGRWEREKWWDLSTVLWFVMYQKYQPSPSPITKPLEERAVW